MGLETGSDEFVPDLRVFDPTREKTRFTGTPHVATEILSKDQAADREAVSLVTIRESIQGFDQLLTAAVISWVSSLSRCADPGSE